ncbi:PHP domain-containing protein [Frankia sp. AiPs1]|uniref:PHP domain-containing protein n=1 Tax=Frankia sp. AiPs1 TaxID=573493 RepID=UPI0020438C57|nr:PHP domain-containing protein [Frankia sp. AiPs1]MCM3922242.1 PHP domain-containing protein [Frankia sp. AiPs1]
MDTMTIDLHTHSTASDGAVEPGELVRRAAGAGLSVLALTDHDSFGGVGAAAAGLPLGLTLIPGVELSCETLIGEERLTLHLLAYLPNQNHGPLVEVMAHTVESRDGRARQMVALLSADGHEISWPQVAKLAGGAAVGKPHIARALVDAGVLATVGEAFTYRWFGPGGPYRVRKWQPDITHAIELVRDAGGVPILAHPFGEKRGAGLTGEHLEQMARAGLAGLEVFHPEHDAAARRELLGIAASLGLIVTGSSDYHGPPIKSQELGAETTSRLNYERIIAMATGARPITRSSSSA